MTFFTLRTTLDMMSVMRRSRNQGAVDRDMVAIDVKENRSLGVRKCQAHTARSRSPDRGPRRFSSALSRVPPVRKGTGWQIGGSERN